ncbi:MAG: hypothetical protein JOZ90_10890 [Alphaproteobacteria bacterium]|nr:hypothetical protein [Alphaproteobacteria bacterium]MBV9371035.1 hypothetical protein [Alphaproteobacteria bacterium]MBV9901591.1 hypothetical protein [Alphaproteobacteria bacterium]
MELNSREIAILIWLGLVIGFTAVKSRDVRRSFFALVRSFLQHKILICVGGAALYSAGCVWLLARFGLWEWANLQTTLLWGLTFAFVTMMDIGKLETEPRPLRRLAKEAVNATALIVFIAEFYTFPLWGELILVPFLFSLGMMIAIGESDAKYATVLRLLRVLQIGAGWGLLFYSLGRIAQELRDFATLTTARELAVPMLLSLMFLPFLYLLILWVSYENATFRLRVTMDDQKLRRFAIWRGMAAFRTNTDLFRRLMRTIQLEEIQDREGIRRAIRQLRELRRRERHPPKVEWINGWSPYAAQSFLAGQGLTTGDYHHGYDGEWWAESPSIEIGGDLFKDRLIYRIAGTETAATRLSLEMNANRPGTPEASDARFWAGADALVQCALGDTQAEPNFSLAGRDEAEAMSGDVRLRLTRDDWGNAARGGYTRRLSLIHPAHRELYPGLE